VATELEKSWAMLMQSLGRAFLQPAAAINRALQGISSGFNAIPKEFWGAIWDTLGQALTGVGVALGKLLGAVDTVVASLLAGIDNLSRAANTPIGRALFKATTLGLSGPPALTDLHGDYQRGKKMVGGILAKGMEAARNPLTGTATQQPAFAGIADFGKQLQISALGQSPQDAEKARLDRENNELWREMNRGIKKIADKDGPMAP
jgi:hypothetical protein